MSNYIKLMTHKKRDRRCDRTARIVLAARPQLCLSVCRALIEEGGNGDDILAQPCSCVFHVTFG